MQTETSFDGVREELAKISNNLARIARLIEDYPQQPARAE